MSSYQPQKYIDKVPVGWGYADTIWMVIFSLILLSVAITTLIVFNSNSIKDMTQENVDDNEHN